MANAVVLACSARGYRIKAEKISVWTSGGPERPLCVDGETVTPGHTLEILGLELGLDPMTPVEAVIAKA